VEWRGFQPARRRNPVGGGKVERLDRTQYINHFIRIGVDETLLRRAMNSVTTAYAPRNYVLGVVGCVSFSPASYFRQILQRKCLSAIGPATLE